MKRKLKDKIKDVILKNCNHPLINDPEKWDLIKNINGVVSEIDSVIDQTIKPEKWTKEEIRNWLIDVILMWDEENEKGESEGKEQLNFLIKELTECKQSLKKTDE